MSDTLTNHQMVLEQLQEAANKITAVSVKLEQQSELVSDHNAGEAAHPYIQQQIQQINSVTPTEVATVVSNHNVSTTSHADIRAAIAELSGSTSITEQVVVNSISNHNVSLLAHTDIRDKVASLNTEMQLVRDNHELISGLEEVYDAVGLATGSTGSLTLRIQDVEDGCAITNAQVAVNSADIAILKTRMDTTDGRVSSNTSLINTLNSNLTAAQLEIEFLKLNGGGGTGTTIGDGVDFTGFTHTLPSIISPNQVINLSFGGIFVPEGETLVFNLSAQNSDIILSKTTNIAPGEVITATVPADVLPSVMKQLIVQAAYVNAQASSTRILVTKVNTKPVVSTITTTLSKILEPGGTYQMKLADAYDIDGQEITYSITPKDNELTFSKTSGILENETITVQVPESATRGTLYDVVVSAIDSCGEANTITLTGFEVHILPDMTSFTHNLPSEVKPGSTAVFRCSGATSADGSAITYKVNVPVSSPIIIAVPIAFAKTTGINPGENVLMYIESNTPYRGESFDVIITAVDAHGAESSITIPVRINKLPVASSIYTTIPLNMASGSSIQFHIYGGDDDRDKNNLTYVILNNTGFTFSKMSGIKSTDIITAVVPTVTNNTICSFDI